MSDITYIRTKEGWLYLTAVMDLFSRRVVGISIEDRLETNLVERAVNQALYHSPQKGLFIILSMSGTGNCNDNAVAESFFHTLKTEHVYQNKFNTREEAKRSLFEYIEVFYNRKRAHSFLGYLSPEEFERTGNKQVI